MRILIGALPDQDTDRMSFTVNEVDSDFIYFPICFLRVKQTSQTL
jgi:hypothetical protein